MGLPFDNMPVNVVAKAALDIIIMHVLVRVVVPMEIFFENMHFYFYLLIYIISFFKHIMHLCKYFLKQTIQCFLVYYI